MGTQDCLTPEIRALTHEYLSKSTTAWRSRTGRCRRTGRQVGLWEAQCEKGSGFQVFSEHEVRTAGVLSHVQLFVTSWTAASQVSLSMEFSRQEYWSGWLFQGFFLTQGRTYFRGNSLLPTSGFFQESNPCLLHCWQILPTEPPGKTRLVWGLDYLK